MTDLTRNWDVLFLFSEIWLQLVVKTNVSEYFMLLQALIFHWKHFQVSASLVAGALCAFIKHKKVTFLHKGMLKNYVSEWKVLVYKKQIFIIILIWNKF